MIKATGLTKHYGALTAVADVSMTVEPGEVLGFLGPNGAGKTTTMRMLAGFIEPSAGHAEICGYHVTRNPVEAKRLLGYLPEGAPSYGEMTTLDFLRFIAAIRGLSASAARSALDDVIGRLNLGNVLSQRIETLSKGFKRRVGLAQAILHDPPVLILDEPTDGLDPNQKHEVRSLINDISREKIIVISTHILEEVDAVCNRAIIIAAGRIVADETPSALIRKSRYHNAVTVRLTRRSQLDEVSAALSAISGVADIETDPANHQVTAFPANDASILPSISELAADRQWPIEQMQLESGRLDEVFRSITTGDAAS